MALTGLRSFQFCRDQRSVASSFGHTSLVTTNRRTSSTVRVCIIIFLGGRLDTNVVFKNGVFLRGDEFLNSLSTSAYRGLI